MQPTIASESADLSAIEAARQLSVDLNRVYVLLRLGRLDGVKINGEWRVSAQSVAERRARRKSA